MNPTLHNLRRLVEHSGGFLEEDLSSVDTRTFQLVAPEGTYWSSNHFISTPIVWARRDRRLSSARAFNALAFADAQFVLQHGLEAIPENERDYYSTEAA